MDQSSGRSYDNNEEDLAYGDYGDPPESVPPDGEEGERGLIGDTYRKIRSRYQPQQEASGPSNLDGQGVSGLGSFMFGKLHGAVRGIGSEISQRVSGRTDQHSHTHTGAQCDHGMHDNSQHRYGSFAPERAGNDVKWYVDGCSYMWAVSSALERASHSIWILDWWLSPELYLRRPPSRNEQYRIDRILQAAAQRGVKVNIVVYKEVTQALTRKYLSPTIPKYLHSLLPGHTDAFSKAITALGLAATFALLEHVENENPLMEPPVTVSSSHTKHALENLHPNISVFRHPDHLPDAQTLQSSFLSSLQNMSLDAKKAASLPLDALKGIYGMNEDVILYWAHHEKLCIVDGTMAFMGGLDLCYGRWDTNQHPIADCHPGNLDDIVFPGQDFNNARVMDFQDVAHWQNNKLDRKDSSRMGWSDVSISLKGPVVEDLRAHFVERWNFIYNEKYDVRREVRYSRLAFTQNAAGALPQTASASSYQPYRPTSSPGSQQQAPSQSYDSFSPPPSTDQSYSQYPPPPARPSGSSPYQNQGYLPPTSRGLNDEDWAENRSRGIHLDSSRPHSSHHHHQKFEDEASNLGEKLQGRLEEGSQHIRDKFLSGNEHYSQVQGSFQEAGIPCQLVRSCSQWSHGIATEHSIADAYINIIRNSQHFVYIENQFFITATSDAQKPVKNKIGAAIVERIIRAARAGQKYKVIIVMPAVPAFAGDLRDDASLGTRAIMEFQYNSINRGGHSIMESIADAGFDPTQYIRFYNLRNYDRINVSGQMRRTEQDSGVNYTTASQEHDQLVELPASQPYATQPNYQRYQSATPARSQAGDWDTVSSCYMLGGPPLTSAPWDTSSPTPEIEAFVSEELYVHSKVLIADDSAALIGSANLNDRSQLGTHDSEIALVINDPTTIPSSMNGTSRPAARFAATLRRQLCRKHLGLIPAQEMERPDQNSEPVDGRGGGNNYDYGSRENDAVMDPLSDDFHALWNRTAKNNTDIFAKCFHPVPHDGVRNWKDYERFYSDFFARPPNPSDPKEKIPPKHKWGHIVTSEFPPGEQGIWEVKETLGRVRGTLVEMPLQFLIEEDIAKEGMGLNAFTEDVYT